MALDAATTALLAQMAETGAKPISQMTPEEARAMSAGMGDLSGPGPEVGSVRDEVLKTPDGGSFMVRVFKPSGEARAVMVYYHGGGWVIGGPDESDTLARQLVDRTQCTVVLVDYRMAPEHRYPTAPNDAFTAAQWTADNLAELAHESAPIIIAGDSAGGNLTAVVAQRARDAGGPPISLQIMAYPVTDCDLDTPCYTDPENQLMLDRGAMVWFWDHYAPDVDSRKNPDASPMRAKDLSGLPPAVIFTAEHDVLRDEGEAYAERLREAGVPVQHKRFAGQMHGFFTMVNMLPGSADAIDYVVEAVDQHLSQAHA